MGATPHMHGAPNAATPDTDESAPGANRTVPSTPLAEVQLAELRDNNRSLTMRRPSALAQTTRPRHRSGLEQITVAELLARDAAERDAARVRGSLAAQRARVAAMDADTETLPVVAASFVDPEATAPMSRYELFSTDDGGPVHELGYALATGGAR